MMELRRIEEDEGVAVNGNNVHDGGDDVDYKGDRVAGNDDDNDVTTGGRTIWGCIAADEHGGEVMLSTNMPPPFNPGWQFLAGFRDVVPASGTERVKRDHIRCLVMLPDGGT